MTQRGFTLMELLIVVALLGIMAGLAAWRMGSSSPGFSIIDCQYRRTAERTLRSILIAEKSYRQAEDAFTDDLDLLPVREVNARATEDIPITYSVAGTTATDFVGTATYGRPGRPNVSVVLRYDADQPNEPRESVTVNGWCP